MKLHFFNQLKVIDDNILNGERCWFRGRGGILILVIFIKSIKISIGKHKNPHTVEYKTLIHWQTKSITTEANSINSYFH
jgi:hypothetical protein